MKEERYRNGESKKRGSSKRDRNCKAENIKRERLIILKGERILQASERRQGGGAKYKNKREFITT